MSFNPYLPFTWRGRNKSEMDEIERTKKLSCWHILSVTTAVVSMVLASMLLIANVTYYINEDHMLEVCGSSDEEETYYTCHYLDMIIGIAKPEVTTEDLRMPLHITYLFTIVLMTHYILATMVLMLGVATNKHMALIPRMLVQFLMALIITGLVLVELYVDRRDMKYDGEVRPNAIRSKYFLVAVAALAFVVANWIVDCVTYLRIKKVNKAIGELQSDFSYARFGASAAAAARE